MQLGRFPIESPIVLAPMAGVTDWAYRCIAAQLGADITMTEMVSSRALVYKDKKSLSLLRKTDAGICGAQIFGNDPAVMAERWRWSIRARISSTSTWAARCRRSPETATEAP